jgi:hypothetical protein
MPSNPYMDDDGDPRDVCPSNDARHLDACPDCRDRCLDEDRQAEAAEQAWVERDQMASIRAVQYAFDHIFATFTRR